MKNTTSKGAWEIKNTTIPLNETTTDENAPEILKITAAAEQLGAEVDGFDIWADEIDGVSVTGPAPAIDALVALFTADGKSQANADGITPLVIPAGSIDIFQAHDIIDTLSNYKGLEAAIYAIEIWAEENAAAFAEKHAREGRTDDAEALLEIYDGEGDDRWADVVSAIDAARGDDANEDSAPEDEEEPAPEEDPYDAAVAAWRDDPANNSLDAALAANAADTRAHPDNLYRAGVFAGMAEAAAWQIYARDDAPDDFNAITAAIYKAYGVAW